MYNFFLMFIMAHNDIFDINVSNYIEVLNHM